MKRKITLLFASFFALSGYSQMSCSIQDQFASIFKIQKIEHAETKYLYRSVQELDSGACFHELVNQNRSYIEYLLTHFSDNSNNDSLLAIGDSSLLQKAFISTLQEDSLFNELLKQLEHASFNAPDLERDTISMNELLNIAVKYFSIHRINRDGYYVGKVCSGINGIERTETYRQPHIEAFCFSSILHNIQGEQFSMYSEFLKGLKQLYTLNLGVDDTERLLRAQGAMYMIMRNNDNLKQILRLEYEKKKQFLPFVLAYD